MSSERENGIAFRPRDYELMILVRRLAPVGNDENVTVFLNGKQTVMHSINLTVSGDVPFPILKINGDVDED